MFTLWYSLLSWKEYKASISEKSQQNNDNSCQLPKKPEIQIKNDPIKPPQPAVQPKLEPQLRPKTEPPPKPPRATSPHPLKTEAFEKIEYEDDEAENDDDDDEEEEEEEEEEDDVEASDNDEDDETEEENSVIDSSFPQRTNIVNDFINIEISNNIREAQSRYFDARVL